MWNECQKKELSKTMKKVFNNTPGRKRSVGKPRNRWLDDVENYLKKMGVTGWRKTDKDRDTLKLILKEARVESGGWRGVK
jgi:hypothetical protein